MSQAPSGFDSSELSNPAKVSLEHAHSQIDSFADFYPFYLNEHSNRTCRRLHFIGSSLVLWMLAYIIINQQWLLLITLPLLGYGFAWVGHFFFEKNKPATFTHPLYSFIGDWMMFKDILIGKILF